MCFSLHCSISAAMINSYIQNSSAMSTEDGSSSTVYGGPQPSRAAPHIFDRRHRAPADSTCQPSHDYYAAEGGVGPSSARASAAQVNSGASPTSFGQRDSIESNAAGRHSGSPRPYGSGFQRGNMHAHAGGSKVAVGEREEEAHYSSAPYMRALRPSGIPAPQTSEQKALNEQIQPLLEAVLPVSTRTPAQEAQLRPLGVYVRTGRGGPNGVTRLVLVRLTDPADPFFLYELELLEDDYGAFKQRLELLVDFQGFPHYLVNLLQDIADGTSPYELSFALHAAAASGCTPAAVAGDASRGTLRVLETTAFKTVEHISLLLLRQGDAGLKKHLAERFQFYEHSFRSAEAARAALAAELQTQTEQWHAEGEALRDALRTREEEMRFMATNAEKEQLAALSRLRDQHAKETSTLRESYEKKLETHTRALEEKGQQLRDMTAEKDAAAAQLRTRVEDLEATNATLQSQLRRAQDTASIQAKELETLREMNDELANFKAEATKAMSENELNYVTLTERLRGTSTALQSRDEKVAALQEHYEKQDAYIRILAEQNKQQADRVQETEKSLEKAHHIISHQLQAIKNTKERYSIATDQLRSQEALLQEREGAMRRQRDELTSANERVQELLRKNNDLRDQLEKTNNAREQLVQEVKQTQQALLRLQQSTSINGRHWGVLGRTAGAAPSVAVGGSGGGYRAGISTLGLSSGVTASAMEDRYGTTASVPVELMREFHANANVVSAQGSYCGVSGGGGSVGASGSTYRPAGSGGGESGAPVSATRGAATGPTLFHTQATAATMRSSSSPSPVYSSQERAGSSETAGLTEPHGRTSTSSLAKTEPSLPSSSIKNNDNKNDTSHSNSITALRRPQPLVRSVSLEKPTAGFHASPSNSATPLVHHSHSIRSAYNELAVKSFFSGNSGAQSVETEGAAQQSAYF